MRTRRAAWAEQAGSYCRATRWRGLCQWAEREVSQAQVAALLLPTDKHQSKTQTQTRSRNWIAGTGQATRSIALSPSRPHPDACALLCRHPQNFSITITDPKPAHSNTHFQAGTLGRGLIALLTMLLLLHSLPMAQTAVQTFPHGGLPM